MQNQIEIQKKPIRLLITGQNSYLGRNTAQYLQEFNVMQGRECYQVECISLRGHTWKNKDFSEYDTVLHMVGIAHADIGQVTKQEKLRYYEVNCNLAVETALKAKQDGVRQFIYMSSVIVYGDSAGVGRDKRITADTLPAPANFYGDSKVKAEQALVELVSENFQVAIVRTPMVYGSNCKGNFPTLQNLAEKLPIFPTVKNSRSMIYVENLTEFLRLLMNSGKGGFFYPQNAEYVSTWDMVRVIATVNGKKILPCPLLNPFVWLVSLMPGKIGRLANKAFGSLTVAQELSRGQIEEYQKYSLEESIRRIYHENIHYNDIL